MELKHRVRADVLAVLKREQVERHSKRLQNAKLYAPVIIGCRLAAG
jgi:hypothetical protein